jgi:hypothetical protein
MRKTLGILVISLILVNGIAQKSKQTVDNSKGKVVTLVESISVYPEDLGIVTYKQAWEMCEKINSQKMYGYNNWRLPSQDELSMIHRNKEKINGLIGGYYISGYPVMNEWGNTVGLPVLNMENGYNKWCRADGECEDYMPVDGKANLRLVRSNNK